MTTDQPTAREALAELAGRLERQDDAHSTWLPPASVARLIREYADTLATTQPEPEPDLQLAVGGLASKTGTIRLGGVSVEKWVTRADLRLDAQEYGPPRLCLEMDVPGVVAEVRQADVEVDIDPALAALLKAAGWTEPDRGPF